MSLIVRIRNRDIVPVDCRLTIPQNKVADIEFVIPVSSLLAPGDSERDLRFSLKFEAMQIYVGNVLVRSGVISDVIPAAVGKNDGYFKVVATDEFGRLVNEWSKPDAHYQDFELPDILDDLLTIAAGWSRGDISTMVDPTVTTTVNLRSKQRLWAQLVEMAESVPKVFLRYGGIDGVTGDYLVDMGLFGERDDSRFAIDGINVFSVKQKRSPVDVIWKIRPKGGKAGDQVVRLNGTETADPDYPISLDVTTGEYVVTNSLLSGGARIAKTYPQIRTQNSEPPTASQLAEVRQALYEATVRDLQISAEREVLTIECELPAIPKIGQEIYVRSRVAVPVWNVLTDAFEYINIREVDGYYRITQIKLNYKKHAGTSTQYDALTDNPETWYLVELEVTDGLDLAKYSETEFLQKQITQSDDSDEPFGAGIGLGGSYVQVVNHNGVAADCTVAAVNGKLFTFPYDPAISANIRAVGYEVIEVGDSANYNVNQEPDLTQPLILCVTGSGGSNWNAGDDIDVTIRYTYYT